MNPVVMKLLTDVYRVDIPRQIEHQRVVEKADYRGSKALALAALLAAAVLGSSWIACASGLAAGQAGLPVASSASARPGAAYRST